MKSDDENGHKRRGVISEEVLTTAYANCVTINPSVKYIDWRTKLEVEELNVKSVNQECLFWDMLVAIQELIKKTSKLSTPAPTTNIEVEMLKLDLAGAKLEIDSLQLHNANLNSRLEAIEAMLSV